MGKKVYKRSDVDALDLMGWNVDAPNVRISADTTTVTPLTPIVAQVVPTTVGTTFTWQADAGDSYTLNIYPGPTRVDDVPVRSYECGLNATFTIPSAERLPAGIYLWSVISNLPDGYAYSDLRLLTVSACGSSDFNGDGDGGTDGDIEAFFRCLSGNCCPNCFGADFNGDGDVGTDADIEAFFRVLAGQTC